MSCVHQIHIILLFKHKIHYDMSKLAEYNDESWI